MKPINQSIFRAYDIRGIVDKDFDEEWIERFGRACGTFFKSRGHSHAVVAHDCRHSSYAYQARMVQGLLATGMHVTYLNMAATPLFYYAVKKLGHHAGIMITASHNSKEYNGCKIWEGEGTVHTEDIRELYAIMAGGTFAKGHGVASELDIEPAYLRELSSRTTLPRPVKVVVDGGNGSAGLVCVKLLEKIGATVIPLYCEPDGTFPNHHPDPTVSSNIQDLKTQVLAHRADLGIGLDGDGDRIAVVDETGESLDGDKLLAIYARDVLAHHPGATVIGEVKCSPHLFDAIAHNGGVPLMWKAGHSLIKAKMRETGALLGGEISGHICFADRFYGFDDAVYAALRLVEILARPPRTPLSKRLASWPVTCNTPEIRMACPDSLKFDIVSTFRDHVRNRFTVNDLDGVRLTFDDGWALVRASNTQPALVLRFEAPSRTRLAEIRKIVEEPLALWVRERSKK